MLNRFSSMYLYMYKAFLSLCGWLYIYSVEDHIPAVRSYKLSDVFTDLLEFAARFLVVGGRLVYWLPQVSTQ